MSLKLLCGRSGTGKTERLFSEFASSQAKKRILLVPESFSSEAERIAVGKLGGLGPNGAEVYSFRRMARAVREQFGSFGREYLTATDRVLLMSTVIDRNIDRLQLLKRAASTPAFVSVMLDLISEWKRYGIAPEQLVSFCETAGKSVLTAKLSDLALLYSAYEERLGDRYADPEDDLSLLAEQLPKTDLFDGADWFLDGFYEFTKTELKILGMLLKSGNRMTVSLLCDGVQKGDSMPFEAVRRTAEKLILTAAEAGVLVEETTVLADRHRFENAPDLGYLESVMAELDSPLPQSAEHLTVTPCSDVYEELHAAAREVLRLCREEGYRFREMALLARDLTPYKALLSQVFRSYGIPVFLDNKVSALNHPTVRFCLLALDAVATGYAPEAMFDYLKSDLLPLPFETLCKMENKVLKEGIRGKGWKTPWEDYLEEARQAVITPLEAFREKVAYGVSGREMAKAFYELLVELNVPDTLMKKEKELLDKGALKEREVTRQVWHLLCGLLDRVADWLEEDRLTATRFAQVLKMTFQTLELGSIPPMQDALLISDTARVRSGRIRAVLLLGANEGECPKTAFSEGILDDRERDTLLSAGLEMAPTGSARTELESLYLYNALSRAEERICIFYHLFAGESALPAYWVQALTEQLPSVIRKATPAVSAPHPTLRLLSKALSDGTELPKDVAEAAAWFLGKEDYAPRFKRLLYRAGYKNIPATLSKEALEGIRPRLQEQSVSGIEKYYSCPYCYYLQRMLGAKERDVLQFSAPEIGTLVHAALERFADRAREEQPADAKSAIRLALKVLKELRQEEEKRLSYSSNFRFVFSQAKKITLRSALAVWEQNSRSAFVQTRQEVKFGFGTEDGYPPLTVPLPDGSAMNFRGVIDRIDRYDDYIRVIDYKTGKKAFSVDQLKLGTQLQLMLYLKAACKGEKASPAGAFYFRAINELYRADNRIGAETAAIKHRQQYKLSGVVLDDRRVVEAMDKDFAAPDGFLPVTLKNDALSGTGLVSADELNGLCDLAEQQLHNACRDIAEGKIPILPCKTDSDPCSYCEMRAVCGFDASLGNCHRGGEEETDDAMDE
ncbi:MAG: PD-(D/E)XK nuclease family protein [Clostridia bacterium]|nr:PD-(D/E)XK nuclease family protein [Clostridia bacterium]